MADRYIVSDHTFRKHDSFETADAERVRLKALHPEKNFRVYRVKSHLNQGGLYPDLIAFVRRIATREPIAVELRKEASELIARHDKRQREASPKTEAA